MVLAYQSWRSCQSVRLSASGLAVAEGRATEAFDGHLYEPLHPGILQNVFLGGCRLEDDVERK